MLVSSVNIDEYLLHHYGGEKLCVSARIVQVAQD